MSFGLWLLWFGIAWCWITIDTMENMRRMEKTELILTAEAVEWEGQILPYLIDRISVSFTLQCNDDVV